MAEDDTRGQMPGDLPKKKPNVPPELSEKSKEIDSFIAKTFSTAAGRKALTWLRDQYMEKVTGYVVDGRGAINAEATTFQLYQQQGQKILIQNIEMRLKRANAK